MRVTHLVGASMLSGAGKAVAAIHEGLTDAGVDSSLIQSHGAARADTSTLEMGLIGKLGRYARTVADRQIGRALMAGGDGRMVSPAVFGSPVVKHRVGSDILHIHWINDGGFRLPFIRALPNRTVWTLHDQWALTGGCHYAFDCRRFETGCNSDCPAMGPGAMLARSMQRAKARAVRNGVHAVAVTSWLGRTAERSPVFAGQKVRTIPNTVDTQAFWPVPQSVAREALGLPQRRHLVLMGHTSSGYVKGADLLSQALNQIQSRPRALDLIGFGSLDGPLATKYTKHFGRVHDVPTLRLLFSAADVFALPSRTEAFGRTVIEAFACGTPVVAFAGSGPDDLITPETGRLVPPYDTAAFADALVMVSTGSESFRAACRGRAEKRYSKQVVAAQHVALYAEILAQVR